MGIKKSLIYRAVTIIGIGLLFLLMLVGFSIYLLPHLGWHIDVLCSGSMEPELRAGELVVTRPVAPEDILVGDIIAFYPTEIHENLVSHRVIGIERNSPLSFKTKGDAYENPDPFDVSVRNLVGRVCLHIPLLGYAVLPLKTSLGLVVALLIPGSIIIGACLRSMRYELVKKHQRRNIRTEG